MSEASVNGFSGLNTEEDQLDIKAGALAVAANCAIERPGVIFPRRGLATSATLTGYKRVYRLWDFQGATMLHYDDGTTSQKIGYLSGGVLTTFSGSVDNPGGSANFRLHETQVSDALFVATLAGLRRYSAFSTPDGFAGVPAMPDMDRANSTTAAGTLIANTAQRAYRSALVYRPAAGPERIGAPSGRLIFRNNSGGAVDPTIRALLPKAVNTASTALTAGNWWVQLYSSDNSDGVDTEPSDELRLVYEYLIKSADVTAGYVDIADKTPYDQGGSALYTNESQQTLGAAKEPPPHAIAVGRYRDCLVLANTTGRQYFELSILATDPGGAGGGGIQDTDTLSITQNGVTFTVTAKTAPAAAADYKLENTGTVSLDIKLTAQNLCAAINRHTSNAFCYAFYAGIPGDVATLGRIIIESRVVNTDVIQLYVGTGDKRTCFEPQLPETAASSAVQSVDDAYGNGWAISEPSEPDAFPSFRADRMGAGNILWISALEDACFFWHDSGEVWMMSGEPGFGADLGTLRTERKFTNLRLLAPFTALVVDDRIIALTDRGVVALSPSGCEVLSRPIDTTLRSAIASLTLATVRQKAFAVAHPSDRRYQLWLAGQGVSVCYELNLRTGAWTTRSGANVLNITAGYYSSGDDFIYYADTVDSTSKVYQESNGQNATDYSDNGEAITSTITLPPFVVGDGTTPKQLREVQVAFEGSQPATVTATVTTELASGSSVGVTSQSTNLCRIPVPQNVQRGVRHTLSLSLGEVRLKWRLSAVKFLYRAYENRGNR